MTHKLYKAFFVFLVGSVFTLGTFAQTANSTIQGTVKDAGGAVVAGATVTLTNVGTTQQLTTTSRADGFYTFTDLAPTNYKLSVTASGFADLGRRTHVAGFSIRVGRCDSECRQRIDTSHGAGRHSCH